MSELEKKKDEKDEKDKDVKTKDEKDNDEKDEDDNEEENTTALLTMQKSYEKKLKEQKDFYENKISMIKCEHNKQIKNMLLGRNVTNEDDEELSDEEKMEKNIIERINKNRKR